MQTNSAASGAERRREVRFEPPPEWTCRLSFDATDEGDAVLLLDGSSQGCGLIARLRDWGPEYGQELFVHIGRMAPRRIRIVWTRVIDGELVRLGCKYV